MSSAEVEEVTMKLQLLSVTCVPLPGTTSLITRVDHFLADDASELRTSILSISCTRSSTLVAHRLVMYEASLNSTRLVLLDHVHVLFMVVSSSIILRVHLQLLIAMSI